MNRDIDSLTFSDTPFYTFQGIDDQFWLWLLTEGQHHPEVSRILPSTPDEKTQRRFTGKAGKENLELAFEGYSLFKKTALEHFGSLKNEHILDFGCGWGRILRFWLKDLPEKQIWGADCLTDAINLCLETGINVNIRHTPVLPPSELPTKNFALIYGYSVFSHLSPNAADLWIDEFSRLLKPRGVLILTTRPRGFLETIIKWGKSGEVPEWGRRSYERMKDSAEQLLSDYDRGEFVYQPRGGSGELTEANYGESYIPKDYVMTKWLPKGYRFIDFLVNAGLPQNVIILQKV